MRFIFILLFFVSCATVNTNSPFAGFTEAPEEDSSDSLSHHYQNGDHHVFFSVIMSDLEASDASRLFLHRKNYLKGLYKMDNDPYFGKTSRSDKCLKGLKLDKDTVSKDHAESVTFNLPSSENFVIGQCNPELETFEAQISFIYCNKTKKFYELKYYRPKGAQTMLIVNPGDVCGF